MRSFFVACFIFLSGSACLSDDARLRFDELVTRYNALEKQFYAQEPAETEDGIKRFLTHHPMNTMVGDFIALEQQARGTEVGFSCLYHLVAAASSVGDPEYPVTRGKVTALRRLADHYHDYPGVETVFRHLFSGARLPETKAFLRAVMTSSSHRYVRGNAMYALANYLALEANLPAMNESHLAVMDRADPEKEAQRKLLEDLSAKLKDVAVERNRAEARRLIAQIGNEYQNEITPMRVSIRTPGLVSIAGTGSDEVPQSKRKRIADLLPAVQFELNHSIGQQAPQIDSTDVTGKRMRLSEFRGQVVVVMFSFKGCGPCEAMYEGNRQLIEQLADRPFVFLGVQGDETIETVRQAVESQTITWRVWWDGSQKRIATQWNVRWWPSTFVLDQHGVIRYRDLRGKELATAVRSLMSEEAE